ncbi:cobalt-zinc-cadmium efflux system membrane fusion protein [Roseivirga ehrenbergii]|uniref:Efflux transporter periplasmic adaptor subunit n=1 Tax=Roseivirga ehrenbergii (strain DSM 102268 / JCM 13514 / KCTC 12282 / NCIMB 14502 / KMM 6017) TaxID=279360 RepID=A0A150WZ12_ROSEK|nr:efflux RND transporter periplasmic adaptor subunit [Roseivirga ehrenbergii]KYG71725.1 efflux transporter periplasmic adaptor subunit [Roseivirga ehrenbergii]TCL07581.1 cobalt-zinc-cadmium efflux system membrane fusion protein [Roseivirga ehrenbergii]
MNSSKHTFSISLFLGSLALVFSILSCGSGASNETLVIEENTDENIISVSNSQFQASAMQLGKMDTFQFSEKVHTTGMFDVPPGHKASVSAYFGGYVKESELLPGEIAKKGQTLFTLENPAYIQMQQDFLEVKNHISFLKSDYERQKSLSEENISSQKKFLQAETEYNSALTQYEALKKKLVLMNIDSNNLTAENMTSVISVKSPISGFITSVEASKGMFLNPSDIAITITNTEHMHMELRVFENDLHKIKVGQKVIFKRQNDPNKTFTATINLINKAIDEENRSVLVHCHLDNEEDELLFIPGMYVEAEILTSNQTEMALPEAAVIEIEGNYYVLVKIGSENGASIFEKRIVKVGITENGFTSILNAQDFKPNTEFLISGAFNLIME